MTITIYPDGHSIQQGTPEELARLVFEMQALQTLQSFRNLVEAIQAEMEKQQKQKEVAATIPEAPKKRPPERHPVGKLGARQGDDSLRGNGIGTVGRV